MMVMDERDDELCARGNETSFGIREEGMKKKKLNEEMDEGMKRDDEDFSNFLTSFVKRRRDEE